MVARRGAETAIGIHVQELVAVVPQFRPPAPPRATAHELPPPRPPPEP